MIRLGKEDLNGCLSFFVIQEGARYAREVHKLEIVKLHSSLSDRSIMAGQGKACVYFFQEGASKEESVQFYLLWILFLFALVFNCTHKQINLQKYT